MGVVPIKKWVFRIVHINNLEYILTNGILNRHHLKSDPNYINIGDNNLIEKREDYLVGINPPGGSLGEFVPFYFGSLSPMLYKIKTGHNGINKIAQENIIYLCCEIKNIVTHCSNWCFTNGHAKKAITEFYNDLSGLDELDWQTIMAKFWNNTEDDFDRMRRKQAEFLVKGFVPIQCVSKIVVLNEEKSELVQELINRFGLNINVQVNPNKEFYY